MSVEYRVRKVSRFVVTEYTELGQSSGITTMGEFDNSEMANRVANALYESSPFADKHVYQWPYGDFEQNVPPSVD